MMKKNQAQEEVNDLYTVEDMLAQENEQEIIEEQVLVAEEMIPLSKFKRLQADYENYKRRSKQEMSNMTCLGREQVIEELLAVVDNFSRALKVDDNSGLAEFKKGMELTYRQFHEVLVKYGLDPIEAEGNPFDPEYHHAIVCIDTDCEDEDDMVLEDVQKGYMVKGKVIRPSMVKVGKYNQNKGEKHE